MSHKQSYKEPKENENGYKAVVPEFGTTETNYFDFTPEQWQIACLILM